MSTIEKRYTININTFLEYYFDQLEDYTFFAKELVKRLSINDQNHVEFISCKTLLSTCKKLPGYLVNEDNAPKQIKVDLIDLIKGDVIELKYHEI
jgi:hypothetical protein